jgi:hypothetical protein
MKRVEVITYTALIYVGGDWQHAGLIARNFCDAEGLCVTVEPVRYVFTGGECEGARVGLINYGRFPTEPRVIFLKAERLARLLIDELDQESASIVAFDKTVWLSRREADLKARTAVEGPSVGTSNASEPKNTPANGDSQ